MSHWPRLCPWFLTLSASSGQRVRVKVKGSLLQLLRSNYSSSGCGRRVMRKRSFGDSLNFGVQGQSFSYACSIAHYFSKFAGGGETVVFQQQCCGNVPYFFSVMLRTGREDINF